MTHPVLALVLLLLCSLSSYAKHVDLPAPFSDDCLVKDGINQYDPADQFGIPWYNVDLDLPPDQRWEQIATQYKDNIAALLQVIKDLLLPIFPDALVLVDDLFGEMADKMPQPYRDEMKSIAKFTGIPLGEIVMYNIFYEIFTVCTSVVATDVDGHMYHARDLDFGLFMGWNETTHEWQITSVLRTMIVNINWIKDGKLLYKSNNFAGFIGIYNGLKPNAFTVTANDRFQLEGGYVGIIKWMMGLEPNGNWMTWNTREVLETATNYDEAMDQLMNNQLLSPVYYIVGGVKPFEGAIISRSLEKTDILTLMNETDPNGWYLLQTNYDPDTVPLYLDDRQTPGDICMRALTRANVGFEGIYNVLSSRTNLNKLTAYTVLMQVESGKFETHLQSCPGDCWPW